MSREGAYTQYVAEYFEQMKKGNQVSLPLWLCGYLAIQPIGSSPIVSLDLPASLSPRVLNALKADPKTVDLRAQAPHFYELAARTLDLFEEDAIVDVLSEVCRIALAANQWCAKIYRHLKRGQAR